jgi:hypothetical protein
MEIKVIHRKSEKEFPKTFLFEGENIRHYFGEFKNKKEFVEKYNFERHTFSGHVIGVPEELWKEEGEERAGTYFIVWYNIPNIDELRFVFVMNSRIYITNKGQTVDAAVA